MQWHNFKFLAHPLQERVTIPCEIVWFRNVLYRPTTAVCNVSH